MGKSTLRASAKIEIIKSLLNLCWMFFLLILFRQFDEKTFGFFALGTGIVYLLHHLLSAGIENAMEKLIRTRLRKEQHKNADRIRRAAFLFSFLTGVIFAVLLFFLTEPVCTEVVGQVRFLHPYRLVVPSVFFLIMSSYFNGYFRGNGSGMPCLIGKAVQLAVFVIGSQIIVPILKEYGAKVAALLRQEEYVAVYGAIGCTFAFLVSSIVLFLFQIVVYFLMRHDRKQSIVRDETRMKESFSLSIRIFFESFLINMSDSVVVKCFFPLQLLLYLLIVKGTITSSVIGKMAMEYVIYAILLFSLFLCVTEKSSSEILAFLRRDDRRRVNDSVAGAKHGLMLVAFPIAVFLCVLSKTTASFLFHEQNSQYQTICGLIGIVAFFGAIMVYQLRLCRKIGLILISNIITGAGFVIGIIVFVILIKNTSLGLMAFPVSGIIYFVASSVVSGVILHKSMELEEDVIRVFGIPCVLSAVTGVLLVVLQKTLGTVFSDSVIFFVGVLGGYLLFCISVVLSRNVNQREASRISGIFLIREIGKISGFL